MCCGVRYNSGDADHQHYGAIIDYSAAERRTAAIYAVSQLPGTHCAGAHAGSTKEFKDTVGDGLSLPALTGDRWLQRSAVCSQPHTNSRTKRTWHTGWNFGGC